MRKKVYIASPYTIGDVAANVGAQIHAANALINLGFAPFAPLLSHFQHLVHPQPYDVWMELDLLWLKQCDYVLRLPGESKGADMEVECAKENNIPVFTSIGDLRSIAKSQKKTSRHRGVSSIVVKNSHLWVAQFSVNGLRRARYFKHEKDAAKQYNRWLELHGHHIRENQRNRYKPNEIEQLELK